MVEPKSRRRIEISDTWSLNCFINMLSKINSVLKLLLNNGAVTLRIVKSNGGCSD